MSSSNSDARILWKISRKSNKDVEIDTGQYFENNTSTNETDNNENPVNILCIINRNNKTGASYYSVHDQLLYIYEEILDTAPQFSSTRTLLREVNPKFILCFGNTSEDFVKSLIDINNDEEDVTITTDGIRFLPKNFFLLSTKDYSYEMCKSTLCQLYIMSSNFTKTCPAKREMYMHSLINFNYNLSVQTAGGLIKYLEQNWSFFGISDRDLQIMHVYQASMKNHILVDNQTFRALQVFNEKSHEASFTHGVQSSIREGLSIFRLYSENCKSKLGQNCLKNILLKPIRDMDEINKRLDFINFVQKPIYKDFVDTLQDNIKHLSDVNLILIKIKNSQASNGEWHTLYKAIYHSVFLNELCIPFQENSKIFKDLYNAVSADLIGLEQSISNCLDFSTNKRRSRPLIKYGLDENLDAKKLRQQDIAKHLTAAARIAVNDLPEFLNECGIVYFPEMGHLISIEEWESDCQPEQLEQFGFQFAFKLRNAFHYKNSLCIELDKRVGDLTAEIIDHENRILRRLTGFVMKYNKDIREPLKVISLIDCLISMAKVALKNNFVRPQLNNNNVMEIEDSRHPLMEIIMPNFQTNDFYSGGSYSKMKIITGPNGSGKSVYLKQIAINIYLAHVGSYVAAKSANIGLIDSIHLRMQATESASIRLSAFMIDISQATRALKNATTNSLVLMDEFGRGTTGDEGFAFLTGLLKRFLKQETGCPHVLVSTHFQKVAKMLPENQLVEYSKMEHTTQDGVICFLFKLHRGISESFAFDIAAALELDEDIITRAKYIFQCLKNSEAIEPSETLTRRFCDTNDPATAISLINIPNLDE